MGDQPNGKEARTEERCTELNEVSTSSRLEGLPVEVTCKNILGRLPITSVAQFKLLSKSLSRIVNDQEFVDMHFSSAAKNDPFLFFSYNNTLYSLDLGSAEISESTNLHELKKINLPFQLAEYFYMVGSCNGYLCLSTLSQPGTSPEGRSLPSASRYVETCIWNPFTAHFVELPSSAKQVSSAFGFGFHQKTGKYKVVKMYSGEHTYVQILTLGTNYWRNLMAPSNIWIRGMLTRNQRGICVDGSMHWLVSKYESENNSSAGILLALDLADKEEFREIPLPDNIESELCECLMEIRGCLAMVVFGEDQQLEIWVMKDYGVEDSWTREFVIEDFRRKVIEQICVKQDQGEMRVTNDPFPQNPIDVIWLNKDDKLLIQFLIGGILCYDFKSERFMNFNVGGLPDPVHDHLDVLALFGSLIRFN